jgi:hypothetical protein
VLVPVLFAVMVMMVVALVEFAMGVFALTGLCGRDHRGRKRERGEDEQQHSFFHNNFYLHFTGENHG